MMLGKRGRPTFRRTTSMTGISFDLGTTMEAAAPPPPVVVGGGYDHLLSPRYFRRNSSGDALLETADFLRSCGLCNRRLVPGRDIYMYRGDTAFCSLECREQQMKQDERKERRAAAAATSVAKDGESHHPELGAAAPEAETVAAA
ncbi:FCS-Like Zinc finger 5 [Sesamum alatum]|uniref:FCS-Like Zinc finger 5 n=1 Tax=Sesamum alatum TaxID=300844 RepID=A0AAE2CQB4_9LAMI|nr:FCS-Like Zinc finger 5 [Sesamum alatum]